MKLFILHRRKPFMKAGDVLNWIEDPIGNTVYEEFEF